MKAVKEAAEEVNSTIIPDENNIKRHDQYLEAFSKALGPKLKSEDIEFELEKEFILKDHLVKPDIYVELLAIIEIKVKIKGIAYGDQKQMEKYVKATRLPGILVSFTSKPKNQIRIKEFPVLW